MSKHPNNQLEAYYTEEGRINYAQSAATSTTLTDHLGNTRVCFMPNPNLTLTNPYYLLQGTTTNQLLRLRLTHRQPLKNLSAYYRWSVSVGAEVPV